jgi:hypothetical protein
VKLLSLTSYLTFHLGTLRLLLPCARRILRANRDAVFAGGRPSRTHCLSGRATVGLGLSSRDGRRWPPRPPLGRSHGGGPGRLGGPRSQCRIGAGPDVLLAAGSLAVKTAASTPGGWQVASSNAGVQTFPGFGTNTRAIRPIPMRPFNSARPMSRCVRSIPSISMIGSSGRFRASARPSSFTGNFFVNGPAVGGYSLYVCHRKGIPGSTSPIQGP